MDEQARVELDGQVWILENDQWLNERTFVVPPRHILTRLERWRDEHVPATPGVLDQARRANDRGRHTRAVQLLDA